MSQRISTTELPSHLQLDVLSPLGSDIIGLDSYRINSDQNFIDDQGNTSTDESPTKLLLTNYIDKTYHKINFVTFAASAGWGELIVLLASEIAAAIGKEIGASIGKTIFPKEIVRLSEDSLRDIANIIREQVDEAFLAHYLREIDGISNALRTFGETNDERKLNEADQKCDSLIPHLYSYRMKAIGGYAFAANLHLTALLAKAKFNPSYMTTFNRLRYSYAGHLAGTADNIRNILLDKLSHKCDCYHSRKAVPDEGDRPHTKNYVHAFDCTCKVDGEVKHFIEENLAVAKDRCLEKFNQIKNQVIDELSEKVNPLLLTADTWSNRTHT